MNSKLKAIRDAVSNLGASASAQIAYLQSLGTDIGPDELALEFDDAMKFAPMLLKEGIINHDELKQLELISDNLDSFSGELNELEWTQKALFSSSNWIKIRTLSENFLNKTADYL